MRIHNALLPAVLLAAAASAAPTTNESAIIMHGVQAGSQTVTVGDSRTTRAAYSFNDRGRGDSITATWTVDAAGVPTEYSGSGNDYMKAPVTESFRRSGAVATWRNRVEHGTRSLAGQAFYVPVTAPPEFLGVLARALLRAPARRLALLPAGEARIEASGTLTLQLPGTASVHLTQYRVTGLENRPTSVWLDDHGGTAVSVSSWFSVLPAAYVGSLGLLLDAQDATDATWAAQVAREQTHVPAGDVLIQHARLFDPRDLSVAANTSVLVRGDRIVRVGPDASLAAGNAAETVDAHGRFLMPGLWDNHQHFDDGTTGAFDLANGVTSSRDMANDTDGFLRRVERFDAGTELGPRVFKAGMIDGPGPLAGPTKMIADSAATAIQHVDWYADHGYGQVKIYSSIKPELVPVIADAAHARGLRVSGHVPAFMTARQFVEGGADEIQHLNFIVLNFLFDTVKDTRDMSRFTAVASHARDLQLDSAEVRDLIALFVHHRTVLDPTMNVFEALFCGDPGAVTPGLESVAPRFPPQTSRGLLSGALAVPAGEEAAYRESFPAMLRLLKALHDAGVTIIPGTDALAGYMLHHELEIYVRAGIPAAEVLRMATLTSARVIGVDHERGVITAGRQADMILVDGDPTVNIGDIRRIAWVMKGGKTYDPGRIERAFGIVPRQ